MNPMEIHRRYLYGIRIDTDLHFDLVDGATSNLVLPAGIYYAYHDPSLADPFATTPRPLFSCVLHLMNDASSDTYELDALSLTDHILEGTGIQITNMASTGWRLVPSVADSMSFFGIPSETLSNVSSVTKESTISYAGAWRPYSLLGAPDDERAFSHSTTRFSDGDHRRSYALLIRRGEKMRIRYVYVPPEFIFAARNIDPLPSSLQPTDDVHNSFDTFHAEWAWSNKIHGLQEILVAEGTGLDIDDAYSIIPSAPGEIQEMRSVVMDHNINGEFYMVDFEAWRL